ncbi:hypothetical protein [Candidatus Palauibacter sp.]|uniref:hypothetical protein n=1 Tax=Candidatus Palauibacter sp. TaxID=3101350 RepID=UPI003AF22DC1
MIVQVVPSMFVWLVLGTLAGFLLGWVIRGRRISGRELTLKRQYDNQLSAVDEDAKRALERARTEAEAKLRRLQTERDRLYTRLSKVDPAGGLTVDPMAAGTAVGQRGRRPRKPRPGSTEASAGRMPGEPDDLKLIKGIGPAFESRLHALGYTTYRDLAGWSAEDLDALGEGLGARIRLEEWSARAAELHRRKYG